MSRFLLVPTVALAVALLVYYTVELNKDPYSNFYRVEFKVVRGLSKKSRVFARGVQVGKVARLDLNDERGTVVVTIKVFPEFIISRKNSRLEVVSANAFGAQRIEVEPGDEPKSQADVYPAEEIITGINPNRSEFLDLLKAEDPIIQDAINEVVKQTREVVNAESSLGRVIGDPDIAQGLDDYILDVRASTQSLEEQMSDLANGHSGLGELISADSEVKEELRDTLVGLQGTLEGLSARVESIRRNEPPTGLLISDRGQAVATSQFVASTADSTDDWTRDDWFLTNDDAPNGLKRTAESLSDGLHSLNSGEGTAGSLIKDKSSADSLSAALENIKASTREIGKGKGTAARLLTDSDVSDQVSNFVKEARKLTQRLHRGIQQGIAGQPVNTIHGALFSVF